MDPRMVWMLIAIVVVIAAAAGWWAWRRRERTAQLRQRFGPEYERVVRESGAVTQGEARLEARAKRVAELHIRPLAPEARTRYADTWNRVQNRFVDDPQGAVTEADRLVGEVMHERGYPLGDFEQRVEDISVDHPDVVMNYRATRDIAARNAAGKTTTEDLRQAMVHYRALFRDLLATPEPERKRDAADREIAKERR
jgi:hypothetical protein